MTSALIGGEWSASRPGRFITGERALGTHWIGGRVDPRDDLDDLKKRKFLILPGFELRPFVLPVASRYTDYVLWKYIENNIKIVGFLSTNAI
jgi:hypothetical protein